jgi:hypothetical protein
VGAKVYLVPFRPLAPPGFRRAGPRTPPARRVKQGESITVVGGPAGRGSTPLGWTAADIAQGKAVVDESGTGDARHAIRFLVVAPDGVANVNVGFVRGRWLNSRGKVMKHVALPAGLG